MVLVAIIALLSAMAMYAIRPTVAYRALSLGGTPFEVGLVVASYNVLAVFLALPIGRLADRIGPERLTVVGALLTTTSALALVVLDSIATLALAFAITGLGQTTIIVAQQTTVANRGGREGRSERFGLYSQAASVGQLIGPLLVAVLAGDAVIRGSEGGTGDTSRLLLVFLACAVCSGVSAFIAARLARAAVAMPRDTAEVPAGMMRTARRVLRRPGMLRAMLVSIVVVSSIDMLIAYLPVYGEAHGLSVALVSLLLTTRAAATLVSRVGLGWWLRRFGRRRVLSAGLAMAAASILVLAQAPAEWLLFPVMVAFGLGIGIGQPLTMSWVADQSPRAERATAISIRLVGNRFALLTVPIIMGAIAGSAGIGVAFASVAALLCGGVGAAFATPALDAAPERRTARDRPTG
jgi:MFS family permease